MTEVKYVYKVMYYDDTYMEEPEVFETFDNEDRAYMYKAYRWESEHMYVKREIVE